MLLQAVVVLAISASAMAHPYAGKYRHSLKPSGSGIVVAPTGGVYGMGNSTSKYGPTGTGFATGMSVVPTDSASESPVETVVAPISDLPSDVPACMAASQSTTTIYSTDLVTMTVYAEETTTVRLSATVSDVAIDSDTSDVMATGTMVTETSATPQSTVDEASATAQSTVDEDSATAASTSSTATSVPFVTPISSDVSSATIPSPDVTTESPAASSEESFPSGSEESYPSSSMDLPNEMYQVPTSPATPVMSSEGEEYEAPTSPEAPVISSAPSTGTYSNGKRGLAYNSAKLTNAFAGTSMSWAYNWANNPDGTLDSGIEYVPMLWGEKMFGGWDAAAKAALAAGAKHLLSFNEPDLNAQANMNSASAAAAHIKYMNPYAGQARIGSPAVTNGGPSGGTDGMGLAWMKNFFAKCAGNCKVDFLAFHWYDSADNIAYFKNYVQDVIAMAKENGVNKVWLTEFAASGSNEQIAKFLGEVLPWMDSIDAIERYAYFMCGEGQLVSGSSLSNPVGKAYAG